MDLEEIVSAINEKFNYLPIQVSVRKVPFYISSFFKENRDIIFIHKEKKKSKVNDFHYDEIDFETNDGDITGQPLEAPHSEFDSLNITDTFKVLDEVSEADFHAPLSLLDARSILSYSNLSLKAEIPIWVLTDGSDSRKTVLLSGGSTGGWLTRSWLMYKGFLESPPLENLLKNHAQISNTSPHLDACEVECMYEIHSESVPQDPSLLHSAISLHASWSKMSLEPPLLHHSIETRLNSKVRVGYEKGGLQLIWKQICLIDSYLKLMSNTGSEPVHPTTLPSSAHILECLGRKRSEEAPFSRIYDLLMQPVNVSVGLNNVESSLDHLLKQHSFTDKPSTDITDRLWFLFIECKTYQDLSACLKELFLQLNKKSTLAPFTSPNNISRLGRTLLGEGGVSIHDPIEYLVEVGIEKLKKEMLIIFSKAQIATGHNLNIPKFPNFSDISSIDWLSTARKWHLWLSQVYCSLEILWHIQKSLSLSNTALYSIAPNILTQFCGTESKIECFSSILEDPLLELETPIPVKNIEKTIAAKEPTEWIFSLTSSIDIQKSRSIFYKTSRKNCFPALEKHYNINNEPGVFHWFEFHSISQLIP